jgi:Family of unknown function (DUF5906)
MPLKVKKTNSSVTDSNITNMKDNSNQTQHNLPKQIPHHATTRIPLDPDSDAPEELLTSPMLQTVRDEYQESLTQEMLKRKISKEEAEQDKTLKPIYNMQQQQEYEREKEVIKGRTKRKEERENEAVNPYECYLWGIKELERLGFKELMNNNESKLPGFIEISKVERLDAFDKYGLYTPIKENAEIYRPICAGNVEFVTFLKDNMDDENGKYLDFKQTWLDLFSGDDTKNAGKLGKKIQKLVLPVAKINSVSGTMPAHKRTYPLSWFRSDIQQIDPRDIIPIWNRPEQDSLMIMIGRVLAGASYDTTKISGTTIDSVRTAELFENPVNGKLEKNKITHTFRSIAVLCGAGGTGKSHFLKLVRWGLETTGYKEGTLPLSRNQFNWAPAENCDLLFGDDTTKDSFQDLYKSSQLKSIASSGKISIELKGVDARPGRAVTAVIINTNEVVIEPKHQDSGVSTRFEYLQTKEKSQIKQELGQDYDKYLYKLAKEHNTSTEVLILYFLRRCLDKFLQTIGYEWNIENKAFEIYKEPTLKEELETNKEEYIYQDATNISKLMAEAAIKTQAVNEYLIKNHTKELQNLGKVFLNPSNENNKNYSISHAAQTAEFVAELYARYRHCFEDENSDKLRELGIANNPERLEALKGYSAKLRSILEWILPSKHFNYNSVQQFIKGLSTDAASNPGNVSTIKLWEKHIREFGGGKQKAPDYLGCYSGSFDTAKFQKDSYLIEFTEMMDSGYQMMPISLLKSASKFNSFSKEYSKQAIELLEKEALIKQAEKAEKIEKKASKLKTKPTSATSINENDELEA